VRAEQVKLKEHDETMPGLLGPTTPVPGYENTTPVKMPPPNPNDTSVQNVVDPSRVVRPDGRAEQQDAGNAALAARYESNFMTFIQRLRNSPALAPAFMMVMQGQGLQVTSNLRSGFAAELAQFMEFLQMDEQKFPEFLKGQLQSGARFSGPLFQMLRGAYANTRSGMTQNDILQFVKKFSDFASTGHIEGKILRTTEDMAYSLPSRWSEQMLETFAKLQNSVHAGDRQGSLKLLREEVFPLVSRYVSITHDHGRARGLLSMLALDVARYENGAPEALLMSMRHLASSGALPDKFNELPDDELMKILKSTNFFKAQDEQQISNFAERLSKLADHALKGEGGVEQQEAFRNILSSILINESVYMPLNHIMLPLEWNDRLMFSEIWIDPDEEKNNQQRSESGPPPLRLLIKMDVEGLGAFDLMLNAQDKNVSLQLSCPPGVADLADKMSGTMTDILERNGLQPGMVSVTAMRRPIAVSEVFPKIFERKSGVNVKI